MICVVGRRQYHRASNPLLFHSHLLNVLVENCGIIKFLVAESVRVWKVHQQIKTIYSQHWLLLIRLQDRVFVRVLEFSNDDPRLDKSHFVTTKAFLIEVDQIILLNRRHNERKMTTDYMLDSTWVIDCAHHYVSSDYWKHFHSKNCVNSRCTFTYTFRHTLTPIKKILKWATSCSFWNGAIRFGNEKLSFTIWLISDWQWNQSFWKWNIIYFNTRKVGFIVDLKRIIL